MDGKLIPSALVARYAPMIVKNAAGISILDAASGSGRNALKLVQLGAKVVCADIDIAPIQNLPPVENVPQPRSCRKDGILLIETVPGCGGNYLGLPRPGYIRSAFEHDFDFLFYQERYVGPRDSDAAVVKMVGRRR